MDRNMVDAASGGALMDKTPTKARHLILNTASNTQKFKTRGGAGIPRLALSIMENHLMELTSLVRNLAIGQHQQNTKRVCGICTSMEHAMDMCPTMQEIEGSHTEESESRAIYSPEVWTSREHVGSESE
ncbi:hypothetical protein CR513_15415, partial [Mucuna pruriens]